MSIQRVILIGGPTASGKSAFALDLARREHGVIINADAMQVYGGLPILTAQPSEQEQSIAPHTLYGTFDPAVSSSVARWLSAALQEISEAHLNGYVPILVGGTGLYFRALTDGLANIPDIPDQVRILSQRIYDEVGEAKFRTELSTLDPLSASKIARNDRQRLVRAYEVARHTGKPLSFWQNNAKQKVTGSLVFERHLLMPQREKLYGACDSRFLCMIESGAVDEAKTFLARGLAPALPSMKTIGLREIGAFLNGSLSLGEAIAQAQQSTRNYAKRQMTWFRNQWSLGISS